MYASLFLKYYVFLGRGVVFWTGEDSTTEVKNGLIC